MTRRLTAEEKARLRELATLKRPPHTLGLPPATILALLDEVEELRERVEDLRSAMPERCDYETALKYCRWRDVEIPKQAEALKAADELAGHHDNICDGCGSSERYRSLRKGDE